MKKPVPQCMITYRCDACGLESGYTELDTPRCRYCEELTTLNIVKKQDLTPEAITERLKASLDTMMQNLQLAYAEMSDDEKNIVLDNTDMETRMLQLLDEAKKMKEKVESLNLRRSDSSH